MTQAIERLAILAFDLYLDVMESREIIGRKYQDMLLKNWAHFLRDAGAVIISEGEAILDELSRYRTISVEIEGGIMKEAKESNEFHSGYPDRTTARLGEICGNRNGVRFCLRKPGHPPDIAHGDGTGVNWP